MLKSHSLFVLVCLLQATTTLATPPTRIWDRKQAAAAAAPAIPTTTVISDFKKGNISAQWGEGHPKIWGSEDVKYEFPIALSEYSFAGAVSPDEKFLALANATHLKLIDLDTNTVVSTPSYPNTFDRRAERLVFLSAPGGQYDLLVSVTSYTSGAKDAVFQLRLSSKGEQTGEPIEHLGGLLLLDTKPFNKDGRLIATRDKDIAFIYNMDKPGFNLTLSGHADYIMSVAFSPDSKYVLTSSWDDSAMLWNATSGELIHTFDHTGGQNWVGRFSPDSLSVIITVGTPSIRIYSIQNMTAEPIIIGNGTFTDWIRSLQFTSEGDYLAAGGYGRVVVYKWPEMEIVQNWNIEDGSTWEIAELLWLEGAKKITYRVIGGLELYDFDKNLKYRWGPDDFDHFDSFSRPTIFLKNRGLIGGVESDQKVRFWKYPF